MVTVKNIGVRGVPLNRQFIYPGEHRTVTALALERAEKAHPGYFKVLSSTEDAPINAPPLRPESSPPILNDNRPLNQDPPKPARGRGRSGTRPASVMDAGSDEE